MSNLNGFNAWLTNTASLAADLPVAFQIGWVVILGWAIVQAIWLVRLRAALAVPPMVEAPKPRPRPVKKKVEAAPAPSGDLLQDLGVQVHGSPNTLDSAYR